MLYRLYGGKYQGSIGTCRRAHARTSGNRMNTSSVDLGFAEYTCNVLHRTSLLIDIGCNCT
jgi:hypothetical protein